MKLIDEKGKLFGKLNIIDLLVLVVVIAALAFAALKLRGGSSDPVNATTKLTYTTLVSGVDNATYQEVLRQMEAAGGKDQLMANGEMVDAYVTNVAAVPHVNYAVASSGEVVRSVEDPEQGGRWDLTFTVEANVPDPTTNKVGTQEVRVAKNHILKTVHFEFSYSVVMTCDWG